MLPGIAPLAKEVAAEDGLGEKADGCGRYKSSVILESELSLLRATSLSDVISLIEIELSFLD
jgi:hypothetical protein